MKFPNKRNNRDRTGTALVVGVGTLLLLAGLASILSPTPALARSVSQAQWPVQAISGTHDVDDAKQGTYPTKTKIVHKTVEVIAKHNVKKPTRTVSLGSQPVFGKEPNLSMLVKVGPGELQVGKILDTTITIDNQLGAKTIIRGPTTFEYSLPKNCKGALATSGDDWSLTVYEPAGKVTGTYIDPYPIFPGRHLTPVKITCTLTKAGLLDAPNGQVTSPNQLTPIKAMSNGKILHVDPVSELFIQVSPIPGNARVGKPISFMTAIGNKVGAGPAYGPTTFTLKIPTGFANLTANGSKNWVLKVDEKNGLITGTYKGKQPISAGTTLPTVYVTATPTKEGPIADFTGEITSPSQDIPGKAEIDSTRAATIMPQSNLYMQIGTVTDPAQIGEPMENTITIGNDNGAGPADAPVTFTYQVPAGGKDIKASGGPDWNITINETTGQITGVYQGTYPVPGNTKLPSILVTSTPTRAGDFGNPIGEITSQSQIKPGIAGWDGKNVFVYPQPDVLLEAKSQGPWFVGQSATVTLSLWNKANAGPVFGPNALTGQQPLGSTSTTLQKSETIGFTYTMPDNCDHVQVKAVSDWTTTFDSDSATGKVTGNYTGTFPVDPGEHLTPDSDYLYTNSGQTSRSYYGLC